MKTPQAPFSLAKRNWSRASGMLRKGSTHIQRSRSPPSFQMSASQRL